MGTPKAKKNSNKKRSYSKVKRKKTFLSNHRAIQLYIFRNHKDYPGWLTVARLTRKIGICRQSFYNHYESANDAIIRGEKELLKQFSDYITEKIPDNNHLRPNNNRRVIMHLFLFMSYYKKVFIEVCKDSSNEKILTKMLEMIYPKLDIIWLHANEQRPEIGSDNVDMFFRIVSWIISHWGTTERCKFEKADPYINRILNLTRNTSQLYRF